MNYNQGARMMAHLKQGTWFMAICYYPKAPNCMNAQVIPTCYQGKAISMKATWFQSSKK